MELKNILTMAVATGQVSSYAKVNPPGYIKTENACIINSVDHLPRLFC